MEDKRDQNKMEELEPLKVIKLANEIEGYMELGLLERALRKAEILVSSKVGKQVGLALKAEVLRKWKKYEEAIEVLEQAVKEFPEEESVWINMGWCRKRTGRIDLAIKAMEGLLERNPESPIGHYNLACYLSIAGEKRKSLEELRKAVQLDPSFKKLAKEEKDFDGIRADPDFRDLVG